MSEICLPDLHGAMLTCLRVFLSSIAGVLVSRPLLDGLDLMSGQGVSSCTRGPFRDISHPHQARFLPTVSIILLRVG